MKKLAVTLFLASAALLPTMGNPEEGAATWQRDWAEDVTYVQSADAAEHYTYYKPYAGYVADPMPFYDPVAKDFKVLYLQDYRPNDWPCYHPIWGVSTKDAANYTPLGSVIPCGNPEDKDAAIGTGSTVYNEADKLYYTFYTAVPASETPCLMVATSPDFKTWTKNSSFHMYGHDYGYESGDYRDPCVTKGDDGKWHMFVTTKKDGNGCIAEFTSDNLLNWNSAGVFMWTMWGRFYECPDIFKMGDWWYIVYSEISADVRKVQYFKGRTLDELKACTVNNAGIWPDGHEGYLDSRGLYAGKTASDGTNRYLWGWCAVRPDNNNATPLDWGGNLVAHKVIQHADGSLTLGEVPGISNKFSESVDCRIMARGGNVTETAGGVNLSGYSYALFNRLGTANKISFTVTTSGNWDKFGISLVRGADSQKYYTMVVNPEGDNSRKINFEEEGPEGKGFLVNGDSYFFQRPADNKYNITIYTDNSVCVMYINDICCYTNRIYGIQQNCWSINSYDGANISVSNITRKTCPAAPAQPKYLWGGIQNVTWENTIGVDKSRFADVKIGEKLTVNFTANGEGVIELKSTGKWLPGSRSFSFKGWDTKMETYITADMLELLQTDGLLVCGDKFTATSITVENDGRYVPEDAIWSGWFWCSDWNTLELWRTALDKYAGQRYLVVNISEEPYDYSYDLNLIATWPRGAFSNGSNTQYGKRQIILDTWKLDGGLMAALEGSDCLMIQGNCQQEGRGFNITSVVLTNSIGSETVAVSDLGYASYTPSMDVAIPSGVTAYIATATNAQGVTLTALPSETIIPRGTGVILKAAEGNYTFERTIDAASSINGNLLAGATDPVSLAANAAYLLTRDSQSGHAAFGLNRAGTLAAGKAYLPASALASSAKSLSILFEDETTGISSVAADRKTQPSNDCYNLAGQKVSASYRGIVIVNGKKILK